MKNVVKGFEISKMAVPKVQAAAINKGFQTYHSPRNIHLGSGQPAKPAKIAKPVGVTRRGIRGL